MEQSHETSTITPEPKLIAEVTVQWPVPLPESSTPALVTEKLAEKAEKIKQGVGYILWYCAEKLC